MTRYLRPFSQIEVVPAAGAIMSFRCFSVTSADGVCARRAVRAHHRVYFVLRDQLLVEAGGCFRIGAIIADQKLNRAPEDPALLVYMLLAKQIALADVAALHVVPPGDCNRGANPNRLLREAWPRNNDRSDSH